MAGIFRRFIEIVLDKRSAEKATRDTQDALNKATDSRRGVSNLTRLNRAFNAGARIITQATATLVGYTLAMSKLASRGGQVINVQAAFTKRVGDSAGALLGLRKATQGLINDYDIMVGFNRAATLGAVRTTEEFETLSEVSLTLARALGIDAARALDRMALGLGRQSRLILDDLGIMVRAEDAYEAYAAAIGKSTQQLTFQEKALAFRDAALKQSNKAIEESGAVIKTNADLIQRIVVGFQNLRDQVAIFVAESPALRTFLTEVGNVLETLLVALQTEDLDNLKKSLTILGKFMGSTLAAAFADAFAATLRSLPEPWVTILGTMFGALKGATTGARIGGGPGALLGGTLGAAGGLIGTNVLTEAAPGVLNEFANTQRQVADDLLKELADFRKDMEARIAGRRGTPGAGTGAGPEDLGETVQTAEELRRIEDERLKLLLEAHDLGIANIAQTVELLRLYEEAARALQRGNLSLEERKRLSERLAAIDPLLVGTPERRNVATVTPEFLEKFNSAFRRTTAMPETGPQVDTALGHFFEDNFDTITSAAQVAALGVQSAFEDAFTALGIEGESFGEVFENLFQGIASSALGAIADIAAAKVAENAARAIESVALGLLGDPTKFAAAKEFAAAAAAWAVAGGIAGGLAGAVGGGSSRPGADATGRAVDRIDHPQPNFVIYVDGIDPDNPAHVQLGQRLILNAKEQWADQKPTTRRYSRRTT